MALQEVPASFEQALLDMYELDRRTVEQIAANFYGLGMMAMRIEEGHGLVEDEARRHEPRLLQQELLPVTRCGAVVLVVSEFQRQQVARIQKVQPAHRYK